MTWDEYYHNLCIAVEQRSKCLSRQIGSILVKDKSIIATGYNGPPRGVPTCSERFLIDPELRSYLESLDINPDDPALHNTCPRYVAGFKSGQGLDWCVAGHSERNSLINAARMGIPTKDTILYMNCGVPCTPCLVEIINAGVVEIVVTKIAFYDISSKYLLENSTLKYRVFDHLRGEEE